MKLDKLKIWLIRKRLWLYAILVIILIVTFYSFIKPEECTYDVWKIISSILDSISNSNIPTKWNHLVLTVIFLIIPLLFTYAISVFIFPIQPWNILNTIGKKRKNTAKLCYALLETQLENVTQKIQDLNKGIIVNQDEANEIQEKVLPIVSKKNWYATSLLEPNEIWSDLNHKNSLEYTIANAKDRSLKLIRFIVTDNLVTVKNQVNIAGTAINEIAKLHKKNDFLLYLIDETKFKTCFGACGIDEEYLDFLLVEDEVIYGLKNDKNTYKTITENETYQLFVKDSRKELENYKKLIEKLLIADNHDNSPNTVTLT